MQEVAATLAAITPGFIAVTLVLFISTIVGRAAGLWAGASSVGPGTFVAAFILAFILILGTPKLDEAFGEPAMFVAAGLIFVAFGFTHGLYMAHRQLKKSQTGAT